MHHDNATDFPYDLVMFDLDGTLLETAPELCDAVNDTLAAMGLGSVALAHVRDGIGNGIRALLIQSLARATGQPGDAVADPVQIAHAMQIFEPLYAARCGTDSLPYPQVVRLLHHWHAQGVRLAVVTNKDSRFTQRLLECHDLLPFFHRVIAGDTVAHKKPAPDGILDCLAHFGVPAARALFIGDSSIDVATARNAGVRVWARAGGYNRGQPIADSRPDRVFEDYAAILPE